MKESTLTFPEIATFLQATPTLLKNLLNATPEPITRYQSAPGEWSINEVIGHLIEAEQRGFAGRIRLILSEAQHHCISWDPDQVARERADNDKKAVDLWREFAHLRQESGLLVASLQMDQLVRYGDHPKVGRLTIADLLVEWVYHDLNHLKQIESNLSSWLWPQLGNSQRFYL